MTFIYILFVVRRSYALCSSRCLTSVSFLLYLHTLVLWRFVILYYCVYILYLSYSAISRVTLTFFGYARVTATSTSLPHIVPHPSSRPPRHIMQPLIPTYHVFATRITRLVVAPPTSAARFRASGTSRPLSVQYLWNSEDQVKITARIFNPRNCFL